MQKKYKMCRTREEIIEERPDLQELLLSIEMLQNRIKEGQNGEILLALTHAKTSLNSSIEQIQIKEDMFNKLEDAETKREEIKTSLLEKIDENKNDIKEINKGLQDHLKDCRMYPSLQKAFTKHPFKVVGMILGMTIPTMVTIYLLLFSILYVSGWENVLKAFLNKLFGL